MIGNRTMSGVIIAGLELFWFVYKSEYVFVQHRCVKSRISTNLDTRFPVYSIASTNLNIANGSDMLSAFNVPINSII